MDLYATVTQKQLGKRNKSTKLSKQNNKENKGQSKKNVHDLFVQGTNDSSIVSKRSVEILYNPIVEENSKPYFHYFVKKSPRRTPVINRGYWIRMKSIRMAIEKIIEQQPEGQRINIINLGCGYDPLPFQLLDDQKFKSKHLYCIDVDFPELISYKSQMIKLSPELMELIGPQENDFSVPGIFIRTSKYASMGCDLTNHDLYCQQLDSFKANSGTTTNIFIAEVSLAYMTPETANPIITTSSIFSNSHFLILEQLMPAGENHPFAKRMINHFKKMEAPLRCVHSYPSIPDQITRFKHLGYKYVNAKDLLGCWGLVPSDIKLKVQKVEAFDEWEEFIFFGQHYINLHATNQENVKVYEDQYDDLYQKLETSHEIYNLQINGLATDYQRKFHSCLSFEHESFITCGTSQSRLSDTLQLKLRSDKTFIVNTPDDFKPRIGSNSVTVNNSSYLIGGRRIPGIGIDDVWSLKKYSNDHYKWRKEKSMPSGRVKHSAINLNDNDILVYGGSNGDGFIYYSNQNNEWIELDYSADSEFKKGLESCELVSFNNNIYILGGMIYDNGKTFEFNSKVFRVTLNLKLKQVTLNSIMESKALARYGFLTIVNNLRILVIGGVGKKLYDQNDTIIELNIEEKAIKSVKIEDNIWKQSPVFIGSDIVKRNDLNQYWIVGGGAVCYGFGSVWGKIINFNFGSEDSQILTIS